MLREISLIRLSKLTLLYTAVIISLVLVGPFITDTIAAYVGGPFYKVLVGISIVAYFSLFFVIAKRNKAGWLQYALLVALFALVLVIARYLEFPDEKLHLIEYNMLGCLAMRDISCASISRTRQLMWGCLFVVAVGSLDESLQGVIPWRVCQLSDYLSNYAGGLSGVAMFFLCAKGDNAASGSAR